MCDALIYLDQVEAWASHEHKRIGMEVRYKLGPRLFRALLKQPIPDQVQLSYQETALMDFAIQQIPVQGFDQIQLCRQILGQIQPKIV